MEALGNNQNALSCRVYSGYLLPPASVFLPCTVTVQLVDTTLAPLLAVHLYSPLSETSIS